MRSKIVLDKDGKIVSIGYFDLPEFPSPEYVTPNFGPEEVADQTRVELDVPEEHVRLPATQMLEKLQVAIQAEMKTKKR